MQPLQSVGNKRPEEEMESRQFEKSRFLGLERGTQLRRYDAELNWLFLIPSCLIFESSVEGGIPSLAAAPHGPATFPLHSAKAASMISFSWLCRVAAKADLDPSRQVSRLESHATSIQKVSPLQRITDRSTMFWSSRILPG